MGCTSSTPIDRESDNNPNPTAAGATTGNMATPIPHPNAGHGHFVRSPEFLSVQDTIDNARVADDDLPFKTLPATTLEDKSKAIEEAIVRYKQQHSLDVNDIPFIGLPRTFWYWTANMWHYNRALVMMPAAITEPVDAKHVQVAVQIAGDAGVQVQARSGGHSYGGYGWGGRDGTFVIGLKHLNKVTIDKKAMTATIQPGALLGDVTRIMRHEGVMTPHGICPQVGVGGHCTIGGQGPSSRMYGMMVDQILSFDIVTADGRLLIGVTKDHPEFSDLFWAVRGAAASFGIVTQIVVKIYPDLTNITHWTYEVTQGTAEQLSNAYDAFQEWASNPNLSEKFSSTCIITNGRMAVERTFFGTPEELKTLEEVDELKHRLDVDGVTVKVQTHFFNRYAGALIHWLEDRALSLGGGIPAKFYVKSLVLRADQPISSELSTKLFNWINDPKNQPDLALWFILSDLQGGESNNPKYKETSCYGHRDGLLFFQFYAIDANLLTPTFDQKITAFIEGMYEIVKNGIPGLQVRVYPGYVDPALGPDCEEIYWGEFAPRLRKLKSKYDPRNMFANPQSVRPAGLTSPTVAGATSPAPATPGLAPPITS